MKVNALYCTLKVAVPHTLYTLENAEKKQKPSAFETEWEWRSHGNCVAWKNECNYAQDVRKWNTELAYIITHESCHFRLYYFHHKKLSVLDPEPPLDLRDDSD